MPNKHVMGNKIDEEKEENTSINTTQIRILSEIRNNPNVTKSNLSNSLKLGKTTIDKGISVLKEKGFIKRIGSNKTGYWKVLK